jgi:hypothetical protein
MFSESDISGKMICCLFPENIAWRKDNSAVTNILINRLLHIFSHAFVNRPIYTPACREYKTGFMLLYTESPPE